MCKISWSHSLQSASKQAVGSPTPQLDIHTWIKYLFTSLQLKSNTGTLLRFQVRLSWETFTQRLTVQQITFSISALAEIMNDRAGRGVELPLHQPVLWLQLQRFGGIKDVHEGRPAVLLVCLEDHRQLKCRGDTWVGDDAPDRLQAIFALHVDLDGGTPEPTGLIGGAAHHVLAHPGGHVARQQQHLAVQDGGFSLGQTVLYLPGHILLKELLLVLQTSIKVGN